MGTQISIDIAHGGSNVDADDIHRAETAALAVIAEAGTTPAAAYAEFQRQWAEFDDYELLTGIAAVWVDAERAADCALTEGWANPDGAHCYITA